MIRPSLFEFYSSRKVMFLFRKTCRLVPAYKKFLLDHNIDPADIRNEADFDKFVPVTDKQNYIRTYSLSERCLNGRLPANGTFEESSGSTGNPTLWIRSKQEEEYTLALSRASLLHLYSFGKENKFIALNCFMMGGWSGGLRFANCLSSLATVRNTGQDPQKTIDCIRELGNDYTYLIGGYPPYITNLIEYGKSIDNFSWKDFRIHVFAGGEGFVEEWRGFVSSQLRTGALIFSDYGAIDLDVGISVETPFSVALRKITNTDATLRRNIFSTDRIPCFVGQCSPQQFYVREKTYEKGLRELEITVMNLKSAAPVIKYVIGDEGGIIRFQELSKILELSGCSIEKIRQDFKIECVIPFPLIFLFGRKDGTVSINGAMISKDEIERALIAEPELTGSIGNFKISSEQDYENHIRLAVWLEAKKGTIITDALCKKCSEAILNSLLKSNECFKKSYNANPSVNNPVIRLLNYRTDIFSIRDDKIKNIYSA
jgi:phenylacetate-CoA ligase